jgi:hypothetical protein
VLAHDAVALSLTAAPAATPGVRDLVARTSSVPLQSWSYAVTSVQPGPVTGEWVVTANLTYRLAGDPAANASPATMRRVLVAAEPSGLLALADDPAGASLPWDLGTVTYAAGRHSAVLSTTGPPAAATVADADAAELAVTAVWGPEWSRRPVVVAVAGPPQLAAVTGRAPAGVAGLVAVSTPDRVYLDEAAFARLNLASQRVLLTHEVTHVATAAGADLHTPQWLKEGFADYVGFLGSGIGPSVAAAPLLARVRASGPPLALPADAAYAPGAATSVTADAYAGGWLMCVLVATGGRAELVAVYRATAAGTGTPTANVDAALRRVTGRSLATWTVAWRADLRRLAAGAPVAGTAP